MLVVQHDHARINGRLATVRETAELVHRLGTWRAAIIMKRLEQEGLVYRIGTDWATGNLTPKGAAYAILYAGTAVRHRAPLVARKAVQDAARTMFPAMVREPGESAALKTGGVMKLGSHVTKGRWAGLPIYYVTLEERATCPRSCLQWATCYGNNMHRSIRLRHGPALQLAIRGELEDLERRYWQGFVVRLHELGDFYSHDYVDLWRCALRDFTGLRIFGYTAHAAGTAMGDDVLSLNGAHCRIRTSGSGGSWSAWVGSAAPADAIQCPEQAEKTKNCGTCGLCWTTPRPIRFLPH